jgi:hypothetical protein
MNEETKKEGGTLGQDHRVGQEANDRMDVREAVWRTIAVFIKRDFSGLMATCHLITDKEKSKVKVVLYENLLWSREIVSLKSSPSFILEEIQELSNGINQIINEEAK